MLRAVVGNCRPSDDASRQPGPATILLVPFADGIGDFVNMLPIIDTVRAQHPSAAITVTASPYARELLPDTGVRIVTPSWLLRETSPRLVRLRWLISQRLVATASTLGLRSELGRFDLTINLFKTWEHGMAFSRDWTPQMPHRPNAVHTLDYLAGRLIDWGMELPVSRRAPRLVPTANARAAVAVEWHRLGLGDRTVVGLAPASNMAIKQWPIASWARLNDALHQDGLRTVLFLPSSDHPCARLLEQAEHPPVLFVDTLSNVGAALERCRLVVSVDTGLLHMTAALDRPYVGLFGPTNPDMTGPYDRSIGVCLIAPFPKVAQCSRCWRSFKYEDDRCRAFECGSCMAALDAGTVIEAARTVLHRDVAPQISV